MEFKSIYAKQRFGVNGKRYQFVGGHFATDDESVAEHLRKMVGTVTEIKAEEEPKKPAPKAAAKAKTSEK